MDREWVSQRNQVEAEAAQSFLIFRPYPCRWDEHIALPGFINHMRPYDIPTSRGPSLWTTFLFEIDLFSINVDVVIRKKECIMRYLLILLAYLASALSSYAATTLPVVTTKCKKIIRVLLLDAAQRHEIRSRRVETIKAERDLDLISNEFVSRIAQKLFSISFPSDHSPAFDRAVYTGGDVITDPLLFARTFVKNGANSSVTLVDFRRFRVADGIPVFSPQDRIGIANGRPPPNGHNWRPSISLR